MRVYATVITYHYSMIHDTICVILYNLGDWMQIGCWLILALEPNHELQKSYGSEAWLRETTGVIVKASLHSVIVYGPEPGWSIILKKYQLWDKKKCFCFNFHSFSGSAGKIV